MIDFERILVPLDSSRSARCAFSVAVCFSRHFGSRIILLHVLQDLDVDPRAGYLETQIDRLIPAVPEDVKHRVRFRLDVGNPSECICEAARKYDSNLIVMGRHGDRERETGALGSVTSRVSRAAPCVVISIDAARPVDAFDLVNLAVLHASRIEPARRAAGG